MCIYYTMTVLRRRWHWSPFYDVKRLCSHTQQSSIGCDISITPNNVKRLCIDYTMTDLRRRWHWSPFYDVKRLCSHTQQSFTGRDFEITPKYYDVKRLCNTTQVVFSNTSPLLIWVTAAARTAVEVLWTHNILKIWYQSYLWHNKMFVFWNT